MQAVSGPEGCGEGWWGARHVGRRSICLVFDVEVGVYCAVSYVGGKDGPAKQDADSYSFLFCKSRLKLADSSEKEDLPCRYAGGR